MNPASTQPFPFDVFLSHSSKDKPLVRVIAKQFRDEEGLRCWYDEWNLQPGLPWQEALEQGLADSASIAVFIGPEKLGPWHNEELREAINRSVSSNDGFRVIPALLPGADPESLPTFLKRMMWVDFRGGIDDELAFKKLSAAIRGEAVEESAFTLPEDQKPFVGQGSYSESKAQFFFGRNRETDDLIELVSGNAGSLLTGDSGVGKTSLVQAGLIPELKKNPSTASWEVRRMRPGSDPLRNLANMVVGLDPETTDQFDLIEKASILLKRLEASDNGLQETLSLLFDTLDRPLLIVMDQLEEMFFKCRKAFPKDFEKILNRFVGNMAEVMRLSDGQVRFLLILRSDFLNEFADHERLTGLFPESVRQNLAEMEEESIQAFIQQSAFTAGAFFEKGLVNSLLKEVRGQACQLSWLQIQLEELWEERKGAWLTVDAFERSGGIGNLVCNLADQFLKKQGLERIEGPLRVAFMRLIEPGEGSVDRRKKADRVALLAKGLREDGIENDLYELTGSEYRLFQASSDSVILCHDILVHEWEPVKELLREDRETVRVLHRMAKMAIEWNDRSGGKGKEFLLKGVMLEELEELEKVGPEKGLVRAQLPEDESLFIKAGIRDRRAKKRRTRGIMAVISGMLVVAICFLFVAVFAQQRAEKNFAMAVENHNLFLEEQAEKVRASVQDIIDRAKELAQREGDYVAMRRELLQQAKTSVDAYSDNENLKGTLAELDQMLKELNTK